MKNEELYLLQADVFKVYANPLRIEIIELLSEQPLSFKELMDTTGALKSNLSQHLTLMTKNGLIITSKVGLHNHYELSSKKVMKACVLIKKIMIDNMKSKNALIDSLK